MLTSPQNRLHPSTGLLHTCLRPTEACIHWSRLGILLAIAGFTLHAVLVFIRHLQPRALSGLHDGRHPHGSNSRIYLTFLQVA